MKKMLINSILIITILCIFISGLGKTSINIYAYSGSHIELTILNEGKRVPPFNDDDARWIWGDLGIEDYENEEWSETIAPNSVITIDWDKTTISKNSIVGIRLFSHYMYRDEDGTITGEKGRLIFYGGWASDDYINYSYGNIWGGPNTDDSQYEPDEMWFEQNRYKNFTSWVLSDDFKGFDISKIDELKDELLVLEMVYKISDEYYSAYVVMPIEKEKYTIRFKDVPDNQEQTPSAPADDNIPPDEARVSVQDDIINVDKDTTVLDIDAYKKNAYYKVSPQNSSYSSKNGNLYNKEGTELIKCTQYADKSIEIPEGVEVVGNRAFPIIIDSASSGIDHVDIYIPASVREFQAPDEGQIFRYFNVETDIYYEGSREQWLAIANNNLVTESYNDGSYRSKLAAAIHYNYEVNVISSEWQNGNWFDGAGETSYFYGRMTWVGEGPNWWVKVEHRNLSDPKFNTPGRWESMKDAAGNDILYMIETWSKIDGSWYFFDGAGYTATNQWYGGYWLNGDGTWTYEGVGSWNLDSNGWWYGDTTGWYAANCWQKIDGKWYYFNSSGYMVTNRYIDGYWIGSDGVCY